MLTVTFTHPDSTATVFELPVDAVPATNALLTARVQRSLDRVDRTEIRVARPDWATALADIDRRSDVVDVARDGTTIFTGRLYDWQYDGASASVQIDGLERVALDGPSLFLDQTSSDATHATTIIDGMPAPLSAGTIEETRPDMKFTAEQIHVGEALRKLADQTRAEIAYNGDGTVDYVERRGVDRDVTLTAADVTAPPEIRADVREDTTEVTVYNPDDPLVKVTETITTDGRSVTRIEETEATTAAGRQAAAEAIADEIAASPRYLELAVGVDIDTFATPPDVGDSLRVDLPEYDVDTRMAVVELERILDVEGERLRLLLSTRRHTRDAAAL